MNFLAQTNNLSLRLSTDDRLHSSHVSLYLALLVIWQQNLFVNPFIINRNQLMSISKIGSYATYHKCIKQLEEFGYIKYTPSFNSYIGSTICIERIIDYGSVPKKA
jgi:hypothetical protein